MSRRILFVSKHCYLDSSNGAAVSSREMLQLLAKGGFNVQVLTSNVMDSDEEVVTASWLYDKSWSIDGATSHALNLGPGGIVASSPQYLNVHDAEIPITLLIKSNRGKSFNIDDQKQFIKLYNLALNQFKPDIVVGYGGDHIQAEVFARARASGMKTIFNLHNCSYTSVTPFADVDSVRVPSAFAADHYRQSLGMDCDVLPDPIGRDRVFAHSRKPLYLTFVNPSIEKGVYPFARIADELGKRRPDIPLLVVESRGSERDVAACGLDLRVTGNVNLMQHTQDPRRFFRFTRVLLMPSVVAETLGRVAVEAMINGIPVVGSDRGALPETLGDAGLTLALPDWLTAASKALPTGRDMSPWIDAIQRLWDDDDLYWQMSIDGVRNANRWNPEGLSESYGNYFG